MKKIGIAVLAVSLFLPSIGLAQKARYLVEKEIWSLEEKGRQDRKERERAQHYIDSLTKVIAQTDRSLQRYRTLRNGFDREAKEGYGNTQQTQAQQQKTDIEVLTKIKQYHKTHNGFFDVKLPQRIIGVYVYNGEYYIWTLVANLDSLYRYNREGIFQNMLYGQTAEDIVAKGRRVADHSILR